MLSSFSKRLIRIFLYSIGIIFFFWSCSKNQPVLEALSNGTSSLDVGTKYASQAACQNCHQKIHSNWKESSHGNSYSNLRFQAALQKEPRVWCLNCHAPLHNLKQELVDLPKKYVVPKIAQEGVNCAVCHVRNDKIYGKKENLHLKEHAVFRDESLSETGICNQCHQFSFPKTHDPTTIYSSVEMQSTGSEFASSHSFFIGKGCQSCHVANLHRLGGATDKKFLRESVKISSSVSKLDSAYQLKIQIEIPKIGHAFPTGDLFRAVSLRAFGESGKQLVEHLIRKNVRVIDGFTISDTRIYPSFWKKNAIGNYNFRLKEKPKVCEIIYHYQFPIEEELQQKISEEELKTVLYSGPCNQR